MATFVSTNVVILSTISLHTRHHAIKHDAPALARCHEHGQFCRKKNLYPVYTVLKFSKRTSFTAVMELELNGGCFFFEKKSKSTKIQYKYHRYR
jgi:hypothetical protein